MPPAPMPNGIAATKNAHVNPLLINEKPIRERPVKSTEIIVTHFVFNKSTNLAEQIDEIMVPIQIIGEIYPAIFSLICKLSAIAGNEEPRIESGNPKEIKVR